MLARVRDRASLLCHPICIVITGVVNSRVANYRRVSCFYCQPVLPFYLLFHLALLKLL